MFMLVGRKKTTFLPKSFPACLCQICDTTMSFFLVGDDCDVFSFPFILLSFLSYFLFQVLSFFENINVNSYCKTNISQFAPCGHKLAMQNDILLLAWKLYKGIIFIIYIASFSILLSSSLYILFITPTLLLNAPPITFTKLD
ncbi:unnamed protein product [Citrullus colocynthis]|uniref:Uncharacterized protein n=1 Tax=Citrullus colocynthis TaxID=252529 RepID=A0ABP0Y9V3_9ROSI